MPLFEYECTDCEHREELLLPFSEYTPQRKCVSCGGSACRVWAPPHLDTDTVFMAGHGTLADQLGGDDEAARVATAAKKQGYTPGYNDVYCPTMASKVGDPAAFITPGDGKQHIRDLCEKRGMSCYGRVEHKPSERPPKPKVRLSEKFIRRRTKELIKQDPGLASKPKQELREQLIETHAFR